MQARKNNFFTSKFIKLIALSITTTWIFIFAALTQAQNADLVIFSFNRPIQLYALLESTNLYVTGLDEVHVIYRTENDKNELAKNYELGYQEVQKTFPHVLFHKQGQNPYLDFKPLTLKVTFDSPSKYIIFAVDDIIVKDFIDIDRSIDLLEQTGAYGFYFRLGLNINYCYMLNKPDPTPKITKIADDVYAWKIQDGGPGDWGYPNTVDMTLYKKSDIEQEFRTMQYKAPNPLEGQWSVSPKLARIKSKFALCYQESKIVNLPMNLVQDTWQNRNMSAITPKELLDKFNQGLKIDISRLYKINNKSAHIDYMPSFIER